MPRVKLFKCHCNGYDDYDYSIGNGLSDWEEVTDEELLLLKDYLPSNMVIVEENTHNVKSTLISIREMLEERLLQQKKREEKEAKRRQKLAERKACSAEKMIAKARQVLAANGILVEDKD